MTPTPRPGSRKRELLEKMGEFDEAARLVERVDAAHVGDAFAAARAGVQRGSLLAQTGDLDRARSALRLRRRGEAGRISPYAMNSAGRAVERRRCARVRRFIDLAVEVLAPNGELVWE